MAKHKKSDVRHSDQCERDLFLFYGRKGSGKVHERDVQALRWARASQKMTYNDLVLSLPLSVFRFILSLWMKGGRGLRRPKGFIVDLLMPPDRAEDALFNILGRYDYWVEKHGTLKARCIFMTQSLGAVLSFWTDWLLKRAKLLRFLRPS